MTDATSITQTQLEHIYACWDRLAEMPAAEPQQALKFLMEEVGKLISAEHGYWLSALRLAPGLNNDPMLGWRPGPIYHYRESPVDKIVYQKAIKEIESGQFNESVLNHVRRAGSFRSVLLRDHVSAAFFNTPHYHATYTARNASDALFVVAPVNPDAEVYYVFHRSGRHRFSQTQLALATFALRGLNWFNRQTLLSYGLLVAEQPLTPTERRILGHMLTGRKEKEIAASIRRSPQTTHQHVLTLYRKFNVNGRAALMALWLGQNQP